MIERFEQANQYLDKSHKSLQALQGVADINNFVLRDSADESFPYQACLIKRKEKAGRGSIGIISLPGVFGTALRGAPATAEVFKELLFREMPVEWAVTLSPSVSADTLSHAFVSSAEKRARPQAWLLARLIEREPVDSLYFIGHSQGGLEIAYVAPLLNTIMQFKGTDTKIAGIILAQAAGQTKRGVFPAAFGFISVSSLKGEMRQRFPLLEEILSMQERIDEAKQKADRATIARLEYRMDDMCAKYADPQDLEINERNRLIGLNELLEKTKDSKSRKQLLKQRHALLKPIIQRFLQGSDVRVEDLTSKMLFRAARSTVLRKRDNAAYPLPLETRNKNVYPTALLWGGTDSYFPADTAIKKRPKDLYPNAPVLYEVQIDNWPHLTIGTDSRQFAAIVAGVIIDLKKAGEAGKTTLNMRY